MPDSASVKTRSSASTSRPWPVSTLPSRSRGLETAAAASHETAAWDAASVPN